MKGIGMFAHLLLLVILTLAIGLTLGCDSDSPEESVGEREERIREVRQEIKATAVAIRKTKGPLPTPTIDLIKEVEAYSEKMDALSNMTMSQCLQFIEDALETYPHMPDDVALLEYAIDKAGSLNAEAILVNCKRKLDRSLGR